MYLIPWESDPWQILQRFDDACADTLGHISETVEHLDIPNLQRLGLANLKALKQVKPAEHPEGYFMAMNEASNGKVP